MRTDKKIVPKNIEGKCSCGFVGRLKMVDYDHQGGNIAWGYVCDKCISIRNLWVVK